MPIDRPFRDGLNGNYCRDISIGLSHHETSDPRTRLAQQLCQYYRACGAAVVTERLVLILINLDMMTVGMSS